MGPVNSTTELIDSLDEFTRQYLLHALSMEVDTLFGAGGVPEWFKPHYYLEDIAPETIRQAVADCDKFRAENVDDLAFASAEATFVSVDYDPMGADFFTTRQGLPWGFWDRGLGEVGERLTAAARAFPAMDWNVAEDRLVHASPRPVAA